jgi:hypothetical protein
MGGDVEELVVNTSTPTMSMTPEQVLAAAAGVAGVAFGPRWRLDDHDNIAGLICPWKPQRGVDLWRRIAQGYTDACVDALSLSKSL